MARKEDIFALRGSERTVVPGAVRKGHADESDPLTVSVYLRRNPDTSIRAAKMTETLSNADLSSRRYLSRDQAIGLYGACQSDIDQVKAWAVGQGLTVANDNSQSHRTRRVLLKGTVKQVEQTFGVTLDIYEHPEGGTYRGRVGSVKVPLEVHQIVEAVFGLDNRRVGRGRRSRLDVAPRDIQASARPELPTNPWPETFFPTQVADLYSYPSGTDGAGQNIAILAFNGTDPDPHGGYSRPALEAYFRALGLSVPSITDITVTGPGNTPGADTQASAKKGDSTGEVMLDMCVVGAVAPRARLFMYFTEFTEQGWVDALHEAITDENNIDVISISYGNPEDGAYTRWTAAAIEQVSKAFEPAIARGITVCVASGDDGSSDGYPTGQHADFPASSPSVLSIGGTKLLGSSGRIASEVVWNEIRRGEGATGGGISAIFPKPTYQQSSGINVPPSATPPHRIGRGIPDVASVADPETGIVIANVNGKLEPTGGTSAAAPMWAALIARINEATGTRCGFFNPILYSRAASGVLHDITRGNNGAYSATTGWDACTGLGTPNGQALLRAVQGTAPPITHDTGLWRINFDKKHPDPQLFVNPEDALPAAARMLDADTFQWPQQYEPKAQAIHPAPRPDAALPRANVLLVTWTSGEARTMARLMTGDNFDEWYPYTHKVSSYIPKVTGPKAPFNDNKKGYERYFHTLGLYFPLTIGGVKVVAFKSGLHMAYDGTDVPLVDLWKQIIQEVKPDVVITTGTGGGIGADVLLGDVVIAESTRFDLTGYLKAKSFAQQAFPTSGTSLNRQKVHALATDALLKPNGNLLPTPRIPRIITPDVPSANVVSTDTFAFDDSTDYFGLQGLGKCCDMGDATLGLALSTLNDPPKWFSIRNASDPQIPNPTHDIKAAKAESEQIYGKYQMVTTAGSVVASWATIIATLS